MKHTYTKELMTTPAITLEERTPIIDVIKTFKEKNIGFLPITKNNVIIGVITDRDVLIRSMESQNLNTPINQILTTGEIHFISPETTLIDAAKMMAEHKVRRLPVLNDGKVIGILTSKNLIQEPSLLPYVIETYNNHTTLNPYSIYSNSNPHDSVKTADFPL